MYSHMIHNLNLTFDPVTLKTQSVRLPAIINICLSFGSNPFGRSGFIEFLGHRCVTLTFDPMTLITFPPTPSHMMNIYAKFHLNPSTVYRDIASRSTDNGPTANLKTHCLSRRFFDRGAKKYWAKLLVELAMAQ